MSRKGETESVASSPAVGDRGIVVSPCGRRLGALETMIMVELRRTPRLVGRLRPGKTIHIGPSPIEPFAGPKNASAPKCRNTAISGKMYTAALCPHAALKVSGLRLHPVSVA